MTHNKQHSLLNKAATASDILKKHINEENPVRIISHNDADGLSAAGIIARTLQEENCEVHISIVPRLRTTHIRKCSQERYKLFIFTDMGSGKLEDINRIKNDVIIADHHQPDDIETKEHITHVNPHLHGVDGSSEISGSGTAYLIARALDKKHLAPLALAGAFGDMQYHGEFLGTNKLIEQDGVETNSLEIHEGLKIIGKNTQPLYKALAYTFHPPLPGITGDEEGSTEFLEKLGISYSLHFNDLSPEEKDLLLDKLSSQTPEIFGNIYSNPQDSKSIQNIEELSYLLDACGKNKKPGLGMSIALGERGEALYSAEKIQEKYRKNILKGMNWIKKEGAVELNNIQYLYSEDKVLKSVMGTIAGLSLGTQLLNPDLPLLTLARMHNDIKISGRTTREVVDSGVNLGIALRDIATNFSGNGGGHDIAAGAMIPYKDKDQFLHLIDDMVGAQIKEE